MWRHCLLGGALVLALAVFGARARTQGYQNTPRPVTAAEYDKLFNENNNWGRWGKDDKLGTLNLITDAKRKQAAALVKTGMTVSLAHDLSTEEAVDNPNPLKLVMAANFRGDTQTYTYHGTFITHFDALCHQAYKDMMYNGVPTSASNERGCANGVEHFKNGIVTRGILIDIPRLKGVPWLDPPTAIYAEDIEAWEKQAGVKVSAGDALILHTGRWARRAKLGPWKVLGNAAGLHASVIPWFRQRDVAIAAGDTTVDIQTTPPYTEGQTVPLHPGLIAALGMTLIDDVDTEALAETAARLRRWEFMFVVTPLPVPGGTGGPVNPVAIF